MEILFAAVIWTMGIADPQPTLAPPSCEQCKPECKCDPCDCHAKAKPVVSVKKTFTPAEASVIIRATKGKEAYQASGTAICDHTVITCWHITRPEFAYTINGKPATLLRSDSKSDVALFTTEETLKPVSVANEPLKAGESCTAYGYEYNKQGKLWKFPANIVQVNRYRGFPNVSTRGRDPVLSGRSGGGLFNSKGELVGVCSARDGADGLYCGLEAVKAIVQGTPAKIAPKAIVPKPTTPPKKSAELPQEWIQDPACTTRSMPTSQETSPRSEGQGRSERRPAACVTVAQGLHIQGA